MAKSRKKKNTVVIYRYAPTFDDLLEQDAQGYEFLPKRQTVIHKHSSDDSIIEDHPIIFASRGEIIICDKEGNEGLFILNNQGNVVKLTGKGVNPEFDGYGINCGKY